MIQEVALKWRTFLENMNYILLLYKYNFTKFCDILRWCYHRLTCKCVGNNNGPVLSNGSPTLDQGELHNDSIVLNLAPLYPNEQSQPQSLMSTFKGSPVSSEHIGRLQVLT